MWQRVLRWLWRRYLDRLVCLHYCAFRGAGSDLKYTHVHVLPNNPQGASGLGHDDHTNNNAPGHAAVSTNGNCQTQAENPATMALRQLKYLATAYFHTCAEGEIPQGYRRIRCRCGEETVWVCYTLDHEMFQRWYDEQRYTHRRGTYTYPNFNARLLPEGTSRELKCPESLVLTQFDWEGVADCSGFGPADADNAVVQRARAELQAALARLSCASGCQQRATETFSGWTCKATTNPARWEVSVAVQWRVECAP